MLIAFALFIIPFFAFAQEENDHVTKHGIRYVDIRIKALNKYDSHQDRQQKRLLKNLKRKEKRFARKLKKNDSAGYERYSQQPVSYDSIDKLSKNDSAVVPRSKHKKNISIEKVKGAQSFVENKTGLPTPGKNAEIASLQNGSDKRSYINDLISKRNNDLGKVGSNGSKSPASLTGMQKQVFYGKSKMKVFKEMEEKPTKAEDEALEYLQGTDGFNEAMNKAEGVNGMNSIGGSKSEINEELQKRGIQTKQQLQTSLEGKFGSSLANVTKHAGGGLKEWQDKSKDLSGNIKDAKGKTHNLKNTGKPTFRVNPMRGLPFCKRIEKQYNWQVTHASSDGKQPAIVEPSAMYGFKHTPKLTYGLGASVAVGLGQSWQYIHFTFQGIGLRSFATWKWQYGISAYAGYERVYKQLPFIKNEQVGNADVLPTQHNNEQFSESILIGLCKSYNLNKKYNGSIQLLYDIWWQQKGLQSPIVLRFSTIKK